MPNLAENIVVAGNGLVAIAPEGAILPVDASTALDAAFTELGYIDEEGVNFAPDLTVEDIMAWQSLSPIRTLLTAYQLEASFSLMEWTEDSLLLAFGGGIFTDNLDGTWDFDLPAPGERPTYAMVIEGHDGSERYRVVLPRTELIDTDDIPLNKGGASLLGVTIKALAGANGRAGAIYGNTN